MKTRYHTIDIRALVKNLQSLIGLRVANIYDINHRTYLFKLAKPDHKAFLLIESGTRIHTTEFARDKSDVPSVFSLKLRKFLKTKRLESVVQLGVDRVVVFTFGSGLATQYLIVEMYAQGNIILTDGSYLIQALLRPYKISEEVIVAANHSNLHVYPIQTAKPFVALTQERLKEIISSAQKKDALKQVLAKHLDFGPELVDHCILAAKLNPDLVLDNWKDESLPALLEGLQQGEQLFDTFARENAAGYIVLREPKKQQPAKQPQAKKQNQNKKDQKDKQEPKEQDKSKEEKAQPEPAKEEPQTQPQQQEQQPPQQQEQTVEQKKEEEEVFDEVIPYPFLQYANRKLKSFVTFDAAVDKFFSQVEVQKEVVQKNTAETAVQKKIEKFKAEHTKRITSLQQAEASNERKAHLIEANLQEVENCLTIVRSALGSGMDWGELASLVKEEKKKNPHSVANLIHRLVLDKNTVTLLLSDPLEDVDDMESSDDENYDDEDEEEKVAKKPNITRAPELVDVDIGISAFANARKYYELKKQSTQKAQKTVDKTEQALKAAERKSRKAIAEAKTKQGIMLARKPFWFEKFFWFISSENYLILYGRDAQQNEQLYKKYLDKDDIYVHADIHGAATCIIKNKKVNSADGDVSGAIPPLTLSQAGTMCVCLSGAWQAKIVTSAWWVYAHQVSKTAPTGEYLTTGSFMIRGKKNFLPPSQLVLGFAFMFRLDDESTLRHQGERSKARALLAEEAAAEAQASSETVAPAEEDKAVQQENQKKAEEKKDEPKKGGNKEGKDSGKKDGGKKENNNSNNNNNNNNNKNKRPAFPKEEDEGPDVDITKYKINLVAAHPGNIDEPSGDDDDVSTPGSTSGAGESKSNKKRISAKDRRQQKKNKEKGTDPTNNDNDNNNNNNNSNSNSNSNNENETENDKKGEQTKDEQTTTQETKPKTEEPKQEKAAKQPKENNDKQTKDKKGGKDKGKEAVKGGKDKSQQQQQQGKGKKKAKGKTKHDDDLDEDEIQARNLLLGIKKPQAKETKKDEGKGAKKGQDTNGKNAPPKSDKKVIKPQDLVAVPSSSSSTPTTSTGESGEKKGEESEYSQLLKEAGEGDSDSDDEKMKEKEKDKDAAANDINLDCISGTVLDGDVLLHAIPVVAPYSVVSGFKFRVKVTPGHTKRGKGARAAQEALFRQPNATQREKDLIRAVPLEELSRAMLANVKLHAPLAVRKAAKEKAGKDIDFEVSYEDDDKK